MAVPQTLTGRLPFAVPLCRAPRRCPTAAGRASTARSRARRRPRGARAGAWPAGGARARARGRARPAVRLAEDAELPVYTAAEYRNRRLAEVDRAAATGHVPAGLLGRWERALEEAGRLAVHAVRGPRRPRPRERAGRTRGCCTPHTNRDGRVASALLGWGQTRVADPADDFAWLVGGGLGGGRRVRAGGLRPHPAGAPDRDLLRRARLSGELAVARWLLHG